MRLVFYTPRFYPLVGGLEKVVAAWAKELTEKGHEILVITETASPEPDTFPFAVYRNQRVKRIRQLIRQSDMVVQFNISLRGLPYWLGTGKPLVVTHHTLLTEGSVRVVWPQHLKKWVCDHLVAKNICCSHYVARQFHQATVVHSPYNSAVFFDRNLEREPGSIVFAGRLVSDKGVDILMKAMVSLPPGSCYLTIIGDGPERPVLEAKANALNLAVRFAGKLDAISLANLLSQHAVMVVPSRVEPFGITVLEGLASGCRMVVSNAGGLPEAAGGFAYLFENGNIGALAETLVKALNQPIAIDHGALEQHLEKMTEAYTAAQFETELTGVIKGILHLHPARARQT